MISISMRYWRTEWQERRFEMLYQKTRKEMKGLRRGKERRRREKDSVELYAIGIRRREQEATKNSTVGLPLQLFYRHV
jgi:hypothetical protein